MQCQEAGIENKDKTRTAEAKVTRSRAMPIEGEDHKERALRSTCVEGGLRRHQKESGSRTMPNGGRAMPGG